MAAGAEAVTSVGTVTVPAVGAVVSVSGGRVSVPPMVVVTVSTLGNGSMAVGIDAEAIVVARLVVEVADEDDEVVEVVDDEELDVKVVEEVVGVAAAPAATVVVEGAPKVMVAVEVVETSRKVTVMGAPVSVVPPATVGSPTGANDPTVRPPEVSWMALKSPTKALAGDMPATAARYRPCLDGERDPQSEGDDARI